MGKALGGQMGTVLDAGIYDFPDRTRAIKIKVLFNIMNPIRAGMHIGNKKDGVTWIDFRYENLPTFCFVCGLIGHVEDICGNREAEQNTGAVNTMGGWLRSNIYGRRVNEKKEHGFCSNPTSSTSGGVHNPIPNIGKTSSMDLDADDMKEEHNLKNNLNKNMEGGSEHKDQTQQFVGS